jgi:hypothetical protein
MAAAPFEPGDEATRAAFALIDAAEWVETAIRGDAPAALKAALDADPAVALVALLEVSKALALAAGEYGGDPAETAIDGALRLLQSVRQGFGRHG